MLKIDIPGRPSLTLSHLVLDYNGTIALNGALLPAAAERILLLKPFLAVHVLTADTYGTVQAECAPLGIAVETFPNGCAAQAKASIVRFLSGGVCAFGNGFNDIEMFRAAELSVAVLEGEGMCASLLPHADVLVKSVADGLDLLIHPDRLRATLRA